MTPILDFVDNSGPNTLLSALTELSKRAKRIDIVSAFVTRSGVERILPILHSVAERGTVRVVVGLYQGVTEPTALRLLLKAANAKGGRISVAVATNQKLHRKVYAFSERRRVRLVVGSSNLTADGLLSDGEFNVLFALGVPKTGVPRLIRAIPEIVDKGASTPLTSRLISSYEALRSKGTSERIDAAALRSILRSTSRPKPMESPANPQVSRWFRDYMTGFASRKTQALIRETTNWESRGWEWYGGVRADTLVVGDQVLLFDYSGKPAWVRVVAIVASTRTAVSTPDGRHFVAYLEDRRRFSRRRVGTRLWKDLHEAGFNLSLSRSKDMKRLPKPAQQAVQWVFGR